VRDEASEPPERDDRETRSIDDLLAACQGNDPAAAEELAGRAFAMAFVVARESFRFSLEDAEDLAQDVAFATILKLRQSFAIGTWIYRSAQFRCIDHSRRRQTREAGLAELVATSPVNATRHASADRIETSLWDLRAALSSLSPKNREILRLRYRDECTWTDIDARLFGGRRKSQYQAAKSFRELVRILRPPARRAPKS